ncbi:MAG TPA: hypothetical protein VEF04_09560 [Blastocatellia bacterium]|nr:hypothetical protein [Blastocatellia bacterium]
MKIELNEHTRAILGRPNFMCRNIAIRLRELGQVIPSKAEEEQAAVLCFLLNIYLEHGEKYVDVANEKLANGEL